MRENRTHGSEGGGAGDTGSSYPYHTVTQRGGSRRTPCHHARRRVTPHSLPWTEVAFCQEAGFVLSFLGIGVRRQRNVRFDGDLQKVHT